MEVLLINTDSALYCNSFLRPKINILSIIILMYITKAKSNDFRRLHLIITVKSCNLTSTRASCFA